MKFTWEKTEEGYKVTAAYQIQIDWEHGYAVIDGFVVPIRVIDENCIQLGGLLIFRDLENFNGIQERHGGIQQGDT